MQLYYLEFTNIAFEFIVFINLFQFINLSVMGASASGKSILMKVLAGRLQNLYINGEVNVDGSPMDPYDVQNEVSYVPQDDFLMGELSARETLTNNYMMKDASSEETIAGDVQTLLKSFGIDHVADTLIGTVFFRGISGGQRKRVEVCSELICPTSILLLDEPTSGENHLLHKSPSFLQLIDIFLI